MRIDGKFRLAENSAWNIVPWRWAFKMVYKLYCRNKGTINHVAEWINKGLCTRDMYNEIKGKQMDF